MGFFTDNGNEAVTDIKITETLFFDNELANTILSVDWTKKNKQSITLSATGTVTFTDPAGPTSLLLKVVQDATGNRVITWPSSVKWVQGVVPSLSTGGNSVDIVGIYFDGTNYYGNISHNFS
jgi:hypothetical protein